MMVANYPVVCGGLGTKDAGFINNRAPNNQYRQKSDRGHRRRRPRPNYDTPIVRPIDPELRAQLAGAIDGGRFIAFDIETTGGNPEKNGITEIFAVRYEAGEVKETFYSMVNPGIPIPPIVRRMTGINNQMVRGAPRINEVMPGFVEFAGKDVLVSHNTIGDMKFLQYFAKQVCQIDFNNFFLCTHLLVEKLAHEAPDKSLKGLAQFFKLKHAGELHRAEADAYLTLELFKVLVGRLRERGITRIDEAIRLQGDLESGMRLGWGVKELPALPPGPGLFKLYDHEGKLLFLSSAMHLEREVTKLSTFQQLPRQLLRLVLRTYDIQTTRTANLFAAMLAECEALYAQGQTHKPNPGKHVALAPSNLHQRTVQVLFLLEDAAGWRLDMGPVQTNTVQAYGPIRDRRIAGEWLAAVGSAVGSVHHKHGLILKDDQKSLVLSFMEGRLEAEYAAACKQRRSMKLWFKPSERKVLGESLKRMQALLEIKTKIKLPPLLQYRGVLAVADKLKGGWQLYSIIDSLPQFVESVAGSDLDKELRQNTSMQNTLRQHLGAALDVPTAPRSLDHLHAEKINATLWWLLNVNSQAETRFIPAEDLP